MRVFSRDFTIFEKALILILCLVLVGLFYYWFLDQPVKQGIADAEAEREVLEIELTGLQAKIAQLNAMQAELDRLGSLDEVSRMESYNNAKAELKELNGILESADSFSATFANVTRNGDQIRRSFNLTFTTENYEKARAIMSNLSRSQYRCLVGNMTYKDEYRTDSPAFNYSGRRDWDGDYAVTITAVCTFFETMYGGTADAGLPTATT